MPSGGGSRHQSAEQERQGQAVLGEASPSRHRSVLGEVDVHAKSSCRAVHSGALRYSVQWSPDDQEFVATVLEFPSLSWLDEDQFGALRGIERLVSDIIEELTQSGKSVPQPIAAQLFSGRLNLRVPPELHRKLAIEAANHGVHLNKYATERLTA